MKINNSIKLFLVLACLPPLSKFLSWFTPYHPFFSCIFILYILTILYSRMKCKNTEIKSITIKSLVPLLLFIALNVFNYSIHWFPSLNTQTTNIINNYINSLVGWFVISLLTYAPMVSMQTTC